MFAIVKIVHMPEDLKPNILRSSSGCVFRMLLWIKLIKGFDYYKTELKDLSSQSPSSNLKYV